MGRLNKARKKRDPLEAVVLGRSVMNAFVLPGRHVYITRRLLERLPSDDAVALVLAHELAHVDLGHLEPFAGWAKRIPRKLPNAVVATIIRKLEQRVHGGDDELAADASALELCIEAGYDPEKCLAALDVLVQDRLDYGDLDGVYGDDVEELVQDDPLAALTKASSWLKSKLRSHPPLADRREALKLQLSRAEMDSWRKEHEAKAKAEAEDDATPKPRRAPADLLARAKKINPSKK
jgi:predicted Zn-dependent protease